LRSRMIRKVPPPLTEIQPVGAVRPRKKRTVRYGTRTVGQGVAALLAFKERGTARVERTPIRSARGYTSGEWQSFVGGVASS
jgi:hypothetical protein